MMSTKDMAKILFVMLAICFLTKTDGKLNWMRTVTEKDVMDAVHGFVNTEEKYLWLLGYLEQMKLDHRDPHYRGVQPRQLNNPTNSFKENIGETDNEDINVLRNVKN